MFSEKFGNSQMVKFKKSRETSANWTKRNSKFRLTLWRWRILRSYEWKNKHIKISINKKNVYITFPSHLHINSKQFMHSEMNICTNTAIMVIKKCEAHVYLYLADYMCINMLIASANIFKITFICKLFSTPWDRSFYFISLQPSTVKTIHELRKKRQNLHVCY